MILEILKNLIDTFLYFSVFGIIHSLMASYSLKQKLVSLIGNKIAFYRLMYNLISIITFIILLIVLPSNDKIVYKIEKPLSYLLIVPFLFGVGGIYYTSKFFSFSEFLGIAQIKRFLNNSYSVNELDEKMSLRIEGPYKYTRHPIYFFSIIILMSFPEVTISRMSMIICIVVYFYVGSYFEEKRLAIIFGEKYREYKKLVPRIFPRIKLN